MCLCANGWYCFKTSQTGSVAIFITNNFKPGGIGGYLWVFSNDFAPTNCEIDNYPAFYVCLQLGGIPITTDSRPLQVVGKSGYFQKNKTYPP
jgi:hypothetical protein